MMSNKIRKMIVLEPGVKMLSGMIIRSIVVVWCVCVVVCSAKMVVGECSDISCTVCYVRQDTL